MLLRLDESTIKLIGEWMLPLIRETAHSQADTAHSQAEPESRVSKAEFQFTACATPNVRDKISWTPKMHKWIVKAAKSSGKCPVTDFAVDPALPEKKYNTERTLAYQRAVKAWNDSDGSKRHRVHLLSPLHAALGH